MFIFQKYRLAQFKSTNRSGRGEHILMIRSLDITTDPYPTIFYEFKQEDISHWENIQEIIQDVEFFGFTYGVSCKTLNPFTPRLVGCSL